MMKKLSSIGRKTLAISLVAVMTIGVSIGSNSLFAEEEVTVLTKEAFIETVLVDNHTIIGLEAQLVQLENQKESMAAVANMLAQVHGVVPRYNALGKKFIYTRSVPDYARYLSLGGKVLLKMPIEATVAETAEYGVLDGTITPEEKATIMTPFEYAEYLGYGDALRAFGIDTITVSPDQEYETFILPIYVGSKAITSGIESLRDGIKSARGGISVGSAQLYNTVLMFEDLLKILDLSYEVSALNYDNAQEKNEKGLISDISLKISYNDMLKAELNRNKMVRDIDNLKMNMNVMMGASPSEAFEVIAAEDEVTITKLSGLYGYTQEALVQRNEIISLNRSIDDQQFKRIFVRDLYNESDGRYVIELKRLELLKIDLEMTNDNITVEVRELYNDVLEKEQALAIANLDVQDALRQYKELAINVELGFVVESTLTKLNLLVTGAVNSAQSAGRDYLSAVDSLLGASSFGPGN